MNGTSDSKASRPGRKRAYVIGLLLLLILLSCAWYVFYFSCLIGSPSGAVVRYYDEERSEYTTMTLSDQQREHLVRLLRRSRPTFFLHQHDGLNNEKALITLFYQDGSREEYSLWHDQSIMYSGNAEDLTMACMLGDSVHFGASLSPEVKSFLEEMLVPPPPEGASSGD